MRIYTKSAFIFRRDLRLFDNTGLNAALKQSEQVLACFILDPNQIEAHAYQSQPALQFMLQALADLKQQVTEKGGSLYFFKAKPVEVIQELQLAQNIQAVFVNRDYTPFSRRRDSELARQCAELGMGFHSYADVLLNEPEQVLKSDQQPYQMFTPYYPITSSQILQN